MQKKEGNIMNKLNMSAIAIAILVLLSGCDKSIKDPNIVFSEDNKDPIKELETTSTVDSRQLNYKQ